MLALACLSPGGAAALHALGFATGNKPGSFAITAEDTGLAYAAHKAAQGLIKVLAILHLNVHSACCLPFAACKRHQIGAQPTSLYTT